MTPKRKTETPAKVKTKDVLDAKKYLDAAYKPTVLAEVFAPDSGLFLLAELMHMRRVERQGLRNAPLPSWWYECDLCHARSVNGGGEISHFPDCPVMRLK